MKTNSKTVGPRTAQLLAALYDRSRTTFTNDDIERITGLSAASARSLIRKAVARGVFTRLEPGLFVIVPAELGSAKEFAGNPYLVAKELAAGAEYFISHSSAMELHRMVTQPQFVVFTSSTRRVRNRAILGTEFRFVLIKPGHFFGVADYWVTKQDSLKVSDLERTVVDGLRQPEYCGGVTEVAKGLWMRRSDVNPTQLVNYALRLAVGAVTRRLGYLMGHYGIGARRELARLESTLTASYAALDPLLPREGPHLAKWRLQINIPPEELDAIRSA